MDGPNLTSVEESSQEIENTNVRREPAQEQSSRVEVTIGGSTPIETNGVGLGL